MQPHVLKSARCCWQAAEVLQDWAVLDSITITLLMWLRNDTALQGVRPARILRLAAERPPARSKLMSPFFQFFALNFSLKQGPHSDMWCIPVCSASSPDSHQAALLVDNDHLV